MKTNTERNKIKLDRMNFFTDAVLAIILTLLVLDIKVPELSNRNSPSEMFHKIIESLPHFYAFALCFLCIIQIWFASTVFFSLVIRHDHNLGILNIIIMLPICLIPYASSLIGNYPDNPFSFVVFGSLYLFNSVAVSIMTIYVWKNDMLTPELDKNNFEKAVVKKLWIGPPVILLIIGSAFISTILSFLLFTLLLIFWIIMIKKMETIEEHFNT